MEKMSDLSPEERIQYNRKYAVDPEEYLIEAGVAKETDDDRQLAYTEEFEELLQTHVDDIKEQEITESDLAALFGVYDEDVTKKDRDYAAWKIIYTVRKWPSQRALELDIATDRALEEYTGWHEDVPPRQRYRMVESLRSFQDQCFFCGGEMIFNEEIVQSCCGDQDVMTVFCGGCDERFVEIIVGDLQSDVDVSVGR